MFDIEKFYLLVESGEEFAQEELLDYLNSFENVILWGAGNLGTAIGKKLLELGVKIECYWDKKAEVLYKCNNIQVHLPFSKEYDKSTTLVISCIVNGSRGDEWTQNKVVFQEGYKNYMQGMILYEAIICPLKKGVPFDISICTESEACSLAICKLYRNLLSDSEKVRSEDALMMQLVTFIISTRCSLKCKYCGQRLNEYELKDRIDFPLEQIKKDMDQYFEAVDMAGMVSLIGGEPLLHPQLKEIIDHCLTKQNFGVLNITTNGLGEITPELLSSLRNKRVKVSISKYDAFLTPNQKAKIEKNIKLLEDENVIVSVSNPLWVKPNEIKETNYTEEELIHYKKNCRSVQMCSSIKNGKFLPCSLIETMLGLKMYDEKEDYIELKEVLDLKKAIKESLEKSYYEACKFCSHDKAVEIPAGEQI